MENDNKSMIESFFNSIQKQNLKLENYEKVDDTLKNNLAIIDTQLDSFTSQFNDGVEQTKKIKESQLYKSNVEDGLIPYDLGKIYSNMINLMKSAYSWLTLRAEIVEVVNYKKSDVLEEQKAFTIKRDTLKEMREDLKQRDKWFNDVVDARITSLEEKYNNSVDLLERRHDLEITKHLNTIKDILKLVEVSILTKTAVPKEQQEEAVKIITEKIENIPKIIHEEIQPMKNTFNSEREVQEIKTPEYHKKVEEIETLPEDNIDDIDESFKNLNLED